MQNQRCERPDGKDQVLADVEKAGGGNHQKDCNGGNALFNDGKRMPERCDRVRFGSTVRLVRRTFFIVHLRIMTLEHLAFHVGLATVRIANLVSR
nr:hypothetical protein [Marinicella sp. W31]MDC2876641.1 hypothetical protein [Marinicella sp. W31]